MALSKTLPAIALSFVTAACAVGGKEQNSHKGARIAHQDQSAGYFLEPSALLLISADANRDAFISKSEYEQVFPLYFKEADQDANGSLRPIEYGNWAELRMGKRDALPTFRSMDVNLDGIVASHEFSMSLEGLFNKFDKNSDGQVSRDELVNYLGSRRNQMQQQNGSKQQRGRSGGRGPGGGGGRSPM